MRKSVLIAAALGSTVASASLMPLPALAQNAADEPVAVQPSQQTQFRNVLDSYYSADAPGVAVIVTRGGETIYTDGIGVANAETGTPITPNTVFRFASISKQFAAATIMQMVDEGLLSLDDPLSKFLPDYPGAGATMTVRQLLNHTSGIKSYTGIPGWMVEANTDRVWTTADLVAEFADQPLDFEPGTAFAYNNSAYFLIGAVIESVAGRPWYEEVDARIAQPLGLTTMGYRTDESAAPGFASGYTGGREDGFAPSQKIHPSVPGPAGALSGTVADMALWAQALHGGEVVSDASYALMTTPTQLTDGETVPFGFGLVMADIRGRDTIGHSGGIFGFATDSIYLPEEDLFVAVLANTDSAEVGPNDTMQRLVGVALGEPFEHFTAIEADPAELAPLYGVYEVDGGGTRQFYERDGQLYALRTGATETEVFAAGESRFFYGPGSLTWFEMVMGEDGEPVMKMHQGGATEAELATRTGPIPEAISITVPHETLERYAGIYSTVIGNAVLAVNDAGKLTIAITGQPTLPLVPTSQTAFAVQGVDATVTMVEADGAITGFVITQNGQEVPGERLPDQD